MKNIIRINATLFIMAFAVVITMSGCASAPLNTEQSSSDIRAAEIAEAAKVPKASLYLKLAKEELVLAKKYESKNELAKALSMLLRLEADAVRNYLVQKNYDGDLIAANRLGEDHSVANNRSPKGRANNRRVEIIIEKQLQASRDSTRKKT